MIDFNFIIIFYKNSFKANFFKGFNVSVCNCLYVFWIIFIKIFMNWRLSKFIFVKYIQVGRIAKRRGKKRVIIAIARKILVAIYYILKAGEVFNPSDVAEVETTKEQRITYIKNNLRNVSISSVALVWVMKKFLKSSTDRLAIIWILIFASNTFDVSRMFLLMIILPN